MATSLAADTLWSKLGAHQLNALNSISQATTRRHDCKDHSLDQTANQ
jgi:hypothetical protein